MVKRGIFSNIKRLKEIIFLMKKYKLIGTILKIKKNYKKGISTKKGLQEGGDLKEIGTRMRLFFQEAGPTFIKFGQVLSMQIDVLPKEIRVELEKLQDNVPGFSFEEARNMFKEEFDKDFEDVFSSISEIPEAAASLGQVNKAKLKSGEIVAVKIQRPHIREIIGRDIALIRFLFRFINIKKFNLTEEYLEKVIREFENFLTVELDFEIEGRNMDAIRRDIEKDIIIPKVYKEYVSKRVLVMEWVDSTKVTNLSKIEEWKLDKDEIIEKVLKTYLRQILKQGVYHADPHPANIGVTKKGKIVLFDFGVVGSMGKKYRKSTMRMIEAVIDVDPTLFFDEFLKINDIKKETVEDYDEIIEDVAEVIEKYKKSIIPDYPQCLAQLSKVITSYGIYDNQKYVVITRTLMHLFSLARVYGYSDKDTQEIFRDIIKEAIKENVWTSYSLTNIQESSSLLAENVKDFLTNSEEYIEKNLPLLRIEYKEKKREKSKEQEGKYRAFGAYKYPFIAITLALFGFLVMRYYPSLIFKNYPVYMLIFYTSGIFLFFNIFYLFYLDSKSDKRIEIYKYPFFSFTLAGIGILLMMKVKELEMFNYPLYLYVFLISIVIIFYSFFHLIEAIIYSAKNDYKKE